jgi:hemolysin activation/secretion protein
MSRKHSILRGTAAGVLLAALSENCAASPAEAAGTGVDVVPLQAGTPAQATLPTPGAAPDLGAQQPQKSFHLRAVRLKGVSTPIDVPLGPLIVAAIDRDVTLDDLQALADRITAAYHDRGYFLAEAIVPVQTIQDGVAEISVIEGRLGSLEVAVAKDAPVSEWRVRHMLAVLKPDRPLNINDYERVMLLLSDLPGVKAQSSLHEGRRSGTTDLSVSVSSRGRWQAAIEGDNDGTRSSGRERGGPTLRWLSPLGIGDNLDVRLLASSNAAVALGRVSYEAPVGYGGWRAGAGVSRVQYELGGEFSALDARGWADIADVSLNYPLHRSRYGNTIFRLDAAYKSLTDELRAVDTSSHKDIVVGTISLQGDHRDELLGGGYSSGQLIANIGHLDIRDQGSRELDASSLGRHTQGTYFKGNVQLSRLQQLHPGINLYLAVAGQYADSNLDASEKLNIGGADTVRAFPNGELLVDDGLVGSSELRFTVLPDVTLYPFYDIGRGRIDHDAEPVDTSEYRTIAGYGLGSSWARPGNFTTSLSVAFRQHGQQLSEGNRHQPRLLWQFQKNF